MHFFCTIGKSYVFIFMQKQGTIVRAIKNGHAKTIEILLNFFVDINGQCLSIFLFSPCI